MCELLINLLEKLIAAESIIFHKNFPKRLHIIWLTDKEREKKKLTFWISICIAFSTAPDLLANVTCDSARPCISSF